MPGFKTFTAATLTASDANSYLMPQMVIWCTSAARPSSPHEGMTIYEVDTKRLKVYSGSAWESLEHCGRWDTWTPVLDATVTRPELGVGGGAAGRWDRAGRMVECDVLILFGSSGTSAGSGDYSITPPIAADTSISNKIVGNFRINDSSTSKFMEGWVFQAAASDFRMGYVTTKSSAGDTGANVGAAAPWAWSTSDALNLWLSYEAAS